MITIHAIAYNEAFMLPYFIAHYRAMFPSCHIVVFDNESTDNTADLARAFDCEVHTYKTGGKLSDATYLDIKNNCWKGSKTDWNMVVDVDELFHFNERDLFMVDQSGYNMVRSEGWNMVNMRDDMRVHEIDTGVRAPSYDKLYCFKKSIGDVNYQPGAHKCYPRDPIPSSGVYTCAHYKYINIQYMIDRHASFAARLSADNLAKGWGGHYLYPADKIRAEFNEARKNAIKIK